MSQHVPWLVLHVRARICTRPCSLVVMRTTIEFDSDTAKVVEAVRNERGRGVSDAVNELIRRAAMSTPATEPFVPKTHRLGLTIDVSNVSDALDFLEGPDAR